MPMRYLARKRFAVNACLGSVVLPVLAMAAPSAQPRAVSVESGFATSTLREVSEQTGIQLLYAPEAVERVVTAPVSGRMTGLDAIRMMLSGQGLVVSQVNASTVSISQDARQSLYDAEEGGGANREAATAGPAESGPAQNDQGIRGGIPEVLIKGARSLNADIRRSEDDVQPYIVLDAKAIKRSGATDLQTFLNEEMNVGTPISTGQRGSSSSLNGNNTVFALRGLSAEQTLILINGRRAVAQSVRGLATQPDLGGIPLAAVERIEILPSTASGIYGGGATGGAINVILKQDYQGFGVTGSFENTFKATAPTRAVSVSGGFTPDNGSTSIMVVGSFSEQSALFVEDRDFIRSARDLTLQNNPSSIYGTAAPILGYTTNICATTSQVSRSCSPNTQLVFDSGQPLGASRTYVPAGYAGIAGDGGAALLANAGSYNLDAAATAQSAGGGGQSLLGSPKVRSVMATIRRNFGRRVDAFAEMSFSESESRFAGNARVATYTLAAADPANPFRQPIVITTPAFGLDGVNISKNDSERAVAGVTVALTENWKLSGEYSWVKSRFSRHVVTSQFFPLSSPGTAQVRSGAVNVMRDTNAYPINLSEFGVAESVYGPATTTLNNPAARLAGVIPLSLIGGGKPTATFSIERRREELDDTYNQQPAPLSSTYYPSRGQSTWSAYAEILVPIISEGDRSTIGANSLELQIAARHEKFVAKSANTILTAAPEPATVSRTEFSSTDPTYGLRYKPFKQLTLRGSYGRGSFAPNYVQMIPSPAETLPANVLSVVDPLRGNQGLTGDLVFLSGGNPDLLPERARSWSYGFVYKPTILPGFRVSVDRTRISKRNNISALDFQAAIDAEKLLPGVVTREPATPQNDPQGFGVGPISGIDLRQRNFAKGDVDAIDLAFDYEVVTSSIGRGNILLSGTKARRNTRQVVLNAPAVETAGTLASPKWLANASFTWSLAGWSGGWRTQYYHGYWINEAHTVDLSQGSARIERQLYHDVFAGYRFSEGLTSIGGMLSGLDVQLGVKNVFNKKPPIVAGDVFGYSSFGDPRLARYFLTIQKDF